MNFTLGYVAINKLMLFGQEKKRKKEKPLARSHSDIKLLHVMNCQKTYETRKAILRYFISCSVTAKEERGKKNGGGFRKEEHVLEEAVRRCRFCCTCHCDFPQQWRAAAIKIVFHHSNRSFFFSFFFVSSFFPSPIFVSLILMYFSRLGIGDGQVQVLESWSF